MNLYMLVGFASSVLIGISLGVIGGGGSLLTMPVLVYLLGINPTLSSAYSLFVVGVTSLIGSAHYLRQGLVNYRTGLVFLIPSTVAVYLSRQNLSGHLSGVSIMVFFALLMLLAAYSMIKSAPITSTSQKPFNHFQMGLCGAFIGGITGIVGAGGGFLIIPTLVLLARLPIKTAVGTSLFIIACKSLLGFIGEFKQTSINWYFLLAFTLFAVVGIGIGTLLSSRISNQHLKKAFGWFILVVSLSILFTELIIKPSY